MLPMLFMYNIPTFFSIHEMQSRAANPCVIICTTTCHTSNSRSVSSSQPRIYNLDSWNTSLPIKWQAEGVDACISCKAHWSIATNLRRYCPSFCQQSAEEDCIFQNETRIELCLSLTGNVTSDSARVSSRGWSGSVPPHQLVFGNGEGGAFVGGDEVWLKYV